MKEKGIHEGCMDQVFRLFSTKLFTEDSNVGTDDKNRFRLDDWELRDDVQEECHKIWEQITTENLFELTDYAGYKKEFLQLFGFEVDGIDYEKDVDTLVDFDVIDI